MPLIKKVHKPVEELDVLPGFAVPVEAKRGLTGRKHGA
jgi:hypothetical protein